MDDDGAERGDRWWSLRGCGGRLTVAHGRVGRWTRVRGGAGEDAGALADGPSVICRATCRAERGVARAQVVEKVEERARHRDGFKRDAELAAARLERVDVAASQCVAEDVGLAKAVFCERARPDASELRVAREREVEELHERRARRLVHERVDGRDGVGEDDDVDGVRDALV